MQVKSVLSSQLAAIFNRGNATVGMPGFGYRCVSRDYEGLVSLPGVLVRARSYSWSCGTLLLGFGSLEDKYIYVCTRVKVCVCCVCMRVYAVVSSLHPFLCECRGIHTVHYGVLSLYMVVQGLTIVPA